MSDNGNDRLFCPASITARRVEICVLLPAEISFLPAKISFLPAEKKSNLSANPPLF